MPPMQQGSYMVFDRTAQYQAYNLASHTVPKTKQIVMLYDGVIRFMQQAREAIIQNKIEDRFNLLVRASEIVVSLQACLDHESGGDIARILHDYYTSIDMRILSIHRSNSLEMCDSVISELREMREAWHHVDTTIDKQPATTPKRPLEVPAADAPAAAPAAASPNQNGSLQVSA